MEPPILHKFPCDLCGFKAANKGFLRDHINGVHLGVKPYQCDKCEFATAHYSSLAAHKKRPLITKHYSILKSQGRWFEPHVGRSYFVRTIFTYFNDNDNF